MFIFKIVQEENHKVATIGGPLFEIRHKRQCAHCHTIWETYGETAAANSNRQADGLDEQPANSRRAAATTGAGHDHTRKNMASRTARSAK